jgi:hypothetical protein
MMAGRMHRAAILLSMLKRVSQISRELKVAPRRLHSTGERGVV